MFTTEKDTLKKEMLQNPRIRFTSDEALDKVLASSDKLAKFVLKKLEEVLNDNHVSKVIVQVEPDPTIESLEQLASKTMSITHLHTKRVTAVMTMHCHSKLLFTTHPAGTNLYLGDEYTTEYVRDNVTEHTHRKFLRGNLSPDHDYVVLKEFHIRASDDARVKTDEVTHSLYICPFYQK